MGDKKSGKIFDIQNFCIHDGPGIRTTVFLKGCPLRCKWCANPESNKIYKELMYLKSRCNKNGCNLCVEACDFNAITKEWDGSIFIDRKLCSECKSFKCVKSCKEKAIKVCGENTTVEELLNKVEKERGIWTNDGGITFSGGEPLFQVEFLKEAIDRFTNEYIDVVVETSAYCNKKEFLSVMKKLEFVFIDIKHMSEKKHLEGTGVSNKTILKNIEALAKEKNKPRIVIRSPMIKGYNDTNQNIFEMIKFMKKLGLKEINILPYHNLGISKKEQLGIKSSKKIYDEISLNRLIFIKEMFKEKDIECYVGSDTPF